MTKKSKIETFSFEILHDDGQGALIGGFSMAVSAPASQLTGESNNCQGGNCVSGCGTGQNVNCPPGCTKQEIRE